jgi:hypothetical protein
MDPLSWLSERVAPWRAAGAACLIALAAWGALAARRALRAWALRRRMARARAGEGYAEALLLARGLRVVEAQPTRSATVEVDGALATYTVRADYLVADWRGRRYVAEVKTGARAPDPLHAPTRRQLLEYARAYPEAAGVLLVDAERGRVRDVRFP